MKELSWQSAAGATLTLPVTRGPTQHRVTFEATDSPLAAQVSASVLTWVGMGFVLLGIAPLIARRRDFTLWLFFAATEVTGLFLMAVRPRGLHQILAETVAYATFPLFPAVLFHFHTLFPQPRLGALRRPLVGLVYAGAAVLVPLNVALGVGNYAAYASDLWALVLQIYLVVLLLACLALLLRAYRATRDRHVRAQLRIIVLCSGTGLAINAGLMLPALLVNLDVSNWLENLAVMSALTTPFGYAYAMLRYNLLIEGVTWRHWIIRAATSGLVSLAAFFGILAVLGHNLLASGIAVEGAMLVAAAAVATGILGAVASEWVEARLARGNSHVELLASATRELEPLHRLDEYGTFFTEVLPARLKSRGALLFLADHPAQPLQLVRSSAPLRAGSQALAGEPLDADGELARLLRAGRDAVPLSALRVPSTGAFPPADRRFLETLHACDVALVLPLVSAHQGRLIGLVALARKETDEGYSRAEGIALTALAHTASTAAENVLLFETQARQLAQLREEREERAALARYANRAKEEVHTRIARDLHDHALQDLGVIIRTLTALREAVQAAGDACIDLTIDLETQGPAAAAGPEHAALQLVAQVQARLDALVGEDGGWAPPGSPPGVPGSAARSPPRSRWKAARQLRA